MYTRVHLSDGKTYGYGFGWDIGSSNGHPILEHSGSWQGFTMGFLRFPDKLSFVVFTNLDSEHSHPARIAHAVAAIYIPEVAGASHEE